MAANQRSETEDLDDFVNHVQVRGRVSTAGRERVLPSGAPIVTARLVVRRRAAAVRPHQSVDTLDCLAWSARGRRALLSWEPGSLVEVEGAVRRRFWRGPTGPSSRVEIDVVTARRLRRTASASIGSG
ncbi:MAG: single-stranded DNA-binding protein [Actinomycetota bacterium]|nr:single-stranded DNA-binding protein [Actinomycetota bacterium]